MKTTLAVSFLSLLAVPGAGVADVDVHPELSSEFSIDLGIFFPDRKMMLGAGLGGGGESDIDFTDEFEVDRRDVVFALDFGWRFGEKWSLSTQYFETSDEGSAVLEQDLEWNDVVFGAGSSVESSTGFSLYRVFFGRSFGNDPRTDFGFGAGIHWLKLHAKVSGDILVDAGTSFSLEAVSASAPLPNIGFWYKYSLSPRWALRARLDWFAADIDEYDGRLLNWQVGVDYKPFSNVGLGLAYNTFTLNAGVDSSSWKGDAELDFEGAFAFLSFYW